MANDIFGRVVNIDNNVADIKAQLLKSVGATTATNSAGQDPVAKLIKQIDTITGYKLDEELKKFKDALADIRKIYEDMAKKRNKGKGSSGDVVSATESLKKSLKRAMKQTEDGLVDFSEKVNKVLERTGNQIAGIPGAPSGRRRVSGSRRPPMSDDYARKLNEWLNKQKKEGEYARGRSKGAYLPNKGAAAYERLKTYSTDSADGKKAIVNDIVTGVSKGVGGVIGGLTAVLAGPLAGGFVGGFAEGLISLIFKPLAEQFEALSQRATLIYSQIGSDAVDAAKKQQELLFANDDMLETGVSLSKLEKTRNKNAKKGITDAKVLKTITKTGLQLSSQIGSNAEETADMFANWNTQLDLSGNKLNVISRNMLTIGRQTGLTGDNLLQVAKQSQSFMTNMRNAGTFTADAANNIIGFLARAEKTGVSPGAKNILEVLKGSVLNAGDQDTANLLLQAAGGNMDVQNRLTKGTALNDKGSLKVLGSGMRNLLQQVIGRFGATSMKQLTPEQAGEADLVIKGITRGKYGAKELELISDHLEDLGKHFGEQVADIKKSNKLTSGEKATQIQDLTFNAAAASLSNFTDILERNGGNVGAAFAELKGRSTDLAPLLSQLGVDANKSGDAISALIDVQHKQLMTDAKQYKLESKFAELGITQDAINKAKGGDVASLTALQEGFNEIQRRIAEEKRATTDPAFAVQRSLELLRGTIDNTIAKVLAEELPKISAWLTEKLPEFQAWIKDNVPKIINLLTDISKFMSNNWQEMLVIGGILSGVLIAGKLATIAVGIGQMLGFFGGGAAGAAIGGGGAAAAAALAPVALVAGAAVGIGAVVKHGEKVNQDSRDNISAIEKKLADNAADFKKETAARQANVQKMTIEQLDAQIAFHEKVIATHRAYSLQIPKFHNVWDIISGRAAQWNSEIAAWEKSAGIEGEKIGELRTKKFQVAASKMSPQDITANYAKAKRGEAFQMEGLGTIKGDDTAGAMGMLKEYIDRINSSRQSFLSKNIAQIIGATLSPEAMAKGGGAEKTNKTLQDFATGNAYLGRKDTELSTTQRAQRIAAENAEKTLKAAGIDTSALSKIIYASFTNIADTSAMGDSEIISRLEKIAKSVDPKLLEVKAKEALLDQTKINSPVKGKAVEQSILDSINYIADSVDTIVERMDELIMMASDLSTVSAMLPGIDVEEEIKKRQMNIGSGTNEIVANTGETAENTRRTAILLGALLNCMRRNGRAGRNNTLIDGESLDESAFFDQVIDCEWVDTTARSPSYVWKQGNTNKKN